MSVRHPSQFLASGIAATLRARAAEAEALRDLHPEQLELIYGQQWFRALVAPRPLSLPELVRLEEGIAWADGSVGWTVTLCSGAGWFAGFFPKEAFPDILTNKRLCIAGSGAPSGEAHVTEDGYHITGRWDYASGALHATAFTANCRIMDRGKPVLTDDGRPLIRPFLFRKEEVTIDKNWNTIGLIATGSHAFEVKDLELAADRCFDIGPEHAKGDDPIYRYPFQQLAEATLAANLSGMAQHFIDCCESFFQQRIRGSRVPEAAAAVMTTALEEARTSLQVERANFYKAIENSVDDPAAAIDVSETSRDLARAARTLVNHLYPYGGLGAARPDTEINRVWRDLHTATQHNLLVF